ncbi:putative membrane protein YeaQ/YmgE (transglycosylase-associated protein family) [Peribacillus deserti]|uniref:Membrane protein YeaQ/YmgE (Transglycosylase-associated protein family) n=1 Tax=Peribacillus deserti TaxID=673318 RepID=A0ABS2QM66_9BACI|nr:GlsB/YeaQ/YmgE family stress response membrane protein [Peribacillus deserti]MBM7694258.1 putative membrane protein YeaQ/YmgE (transglycosylase-associated protein family) [Peribacillus deserti]
MLGIVWSIVIGGLIGWIAQMIIGYGVPGGIVRYIVSGFAGAWLGSMLLGSFGPATGGFAIIPALIGAILFVFILRLFFKGNHSKHSGGYM